MEDVQSLSHTKWECKYHVVWIPKYRKKVVYGKLREHLGKVLKELAKQRESEILEGHLMGGHVHVLISVPPKYAFSTERSGVENAELSRPRRGRSSAAWFSRRVATGGSSGLAPDSPGAKRRENQELEDKRLDQLNMFE